MNSSPLATTAVGPGIARSPQPHLRLVTPRVDRTPATARAAAYLAGLGLGSLLVAAVSLISGGSGVLFALCLAAVAGLGSAACARSARHTRDARVARAAAPSTRRVHRHHPAATSAPLRRAA